MNCNQLTLAQIFALYGLDKEGRQPRTTEESLWCVSDHCLHEAMTRVKNARVPKGAVLLKYSEAGRDFLRLVKRSSVEA